MPKGRTWGRVKTRGHLVRDGLFIHPPFRRREAACVDPLRTALRVMQRGKSVPTVCGPVSDGRHASRRAGQFCLLSEYLQHHSRKTHARQFCESQACFVTA
jgi:hypothetical protein